MRLSKRALQEIDDYKLNTNPDYLEEYEKYCGTLQRTIDRYGYKKLPLNTCDRNMLKALRMHPWCNTPKEWAILHTYEAFSR